MSIFSRLKSKPAAAREQKELAEKTKGKEQRAKGAEPAAKDGEEKKPFVRGPLAKEGAGDSHRILLRPVVTEKADREQSIGKYAFIVAPDAAKPEIAQAIRDLYGVKPVAVRIVKIHGKQVRSGRRLGQRKDEKKAVVTLKTGDAITVVE